MFQSEGEVKGPVEWERASTPRIYALTAQQALDLGLFTPSVLGAGRKLRA